MPLAWRLPINLAGTFLELPPDWGSFSPVLPLPPLLKCQTCREEQSLPFFLWLPLPFCPSRKFPPVNILQFNPILASASWKTQTDTHPECIDTDPDLLEFACLTLTPGSVFSTLFHWLVNTNPINWTHNRICQATDFCPNSRLGYYLPSTSQDHASTTFISIGFPVIPTQNGPLWALEVPLV